MLIHILFFWNFLCCVKIWCYNIYIYIYIRETRPYAWKQNIFFYFIFYVLMKTGYFNIGFVSLQYKNTNWYWSKYSNKITENHIFLKGFFFSISWNFWLDRTWPKRKLGRNQPKINWAYFLQGWTQPSPRQTVTRGTVHTNSNCTRIVTGLLYMSTVTR